MGTTGKRGASGQADVGGASGRGRRTLAFGVLGALAACGVLGALASRGPGRVARAPGGSAPLAEAPR
ncbi:MAG TPA: hypothetical protein PLR99_22305, partial [Polyangiaceae bacterium]|nr:hypothetical protein [Polyangiaceae bacterium]